MAHSVGNTLVAPRKGTSFSLGGVGKKIAEEDGDGDDGEDPNTFK